MEDIVYRASLLMHKMGMSIDEIKGFKNIKEVEYLEYNKKNGLSKTGKLLRPKEDRKEDRKAYFKEYYLKNK